MIISKGCLGSETGLFTIILLGSCFYLEKKRILAPNSSHVSLINLVIFEAMNFEIINMRHKNEAIDYVCR